MTLEELQDALKAVKEYTGLDPLNIEEFKKGHNEKFFTEKDITSNKKLTGIATGFLAGKLTTKLKRDYKLESAEIEGKSIEEVIDLALQKAEAEKEELKKQITDPSESLKGLQAEVEKYKTKLEEEKTAKLELKKSLELKDQEYATKEKNRKKSDTHKSILDVLRKGEEGKRKPLIQLSEEQELFFNNKIQTTYDLDFEENGKVILTDKEGKRIPNPNKAGEFLEPVDAYYQIAEERKYIQNNAGGKVDKDVLDLGKKPEPTTQQSTQKERIVSPIVQAHLDKMKEAAKQ